MTKRMTDRQYRAVVERAESDAGYAACEAMIPGVCTGAMQHWHHRKLRSQGGGHSAVNGLGLSSNCHNAIHADPKRAYDNGWLVRGFHEPEDKPVLRRGIWVELTEEGGIVHDYK